MSILANLLKKSEEPRDSGQIPPGLIKSVASRGMWRIHRRTYFLVAAGVVSAVAGGFLLVLYLQSRPTVQPQIDLTSAPIAYVPLQAATQHSISSASAIKAVVPSTPEVKPRVIVSQRAALPATKKAVGRSAVSEISPNIKNPRASIAAPIQEHVVPPKDRATIDAYLFAARTAETRRDYQQAVALYRQALGADPDNYRIMNNISGSLLWLGQHEEALEFVNRALALKGDYVSALVNGGIAYGKKGDDETARGLFSRAVSLEPANKPALYNLALSQEKSGMPEDALVSFGRLAGFGDVQGHLGMARIYEGKGEKGEALRKYREITGLSGNEDAAKEIARKRISVLDQAS